MVHQIVWWPIILTNRPRALLNLLIFSFSLQLFLVVVSICSSVSILSLLDSRLRFLFLLWFLRFELLLLFLLLFLLGLWDISSSGSFPDLSCPLLQLGVQFRVVARRLLWVDQLEFIVLYLLHGYVWIEADAVRVLLCRQTLVCILLNLLLHFNLHLLGYPLAILNSHLDDLKCIAYQVILHLSVTLCVGLERWGVVHLQHPGLELLVQDDIESQ